MFFDGAAGYHVRGARLHPDVGKKRMERLTRATVKVAVTLNDSKRFIWPYFMNQIYCLIIWLVGSFVP